MGKAFLSRRQCEAEADALNAAKRQREQEKQQKRQNRDAKHEVFVI
jgi:hypothetical protein